MVRLWALKSLSVLLEGMLLSLPLPPHLTPKTVKGSTSYSHELISYCPSPGPKTGHSLLTDKLGFLMIVSKIS